MADELTITATIAEEFADDTDELSEDQVAKILKKRLEAANTELNSDIAKMMGYQLARTLPKEMWRTRILEQGDLRTIFAKLMITEFQDEDIGDTIINGVEWNDRERRRFAAVLLGEQSRIRQAATEGVMATVNLQDPDAAGNLAGIPDAIDGIVNSWRGTDNVGLLPIFTPPETAIDPTTGEAVAVGEPSVQASDALLPDFSFTGEGDEAAPTATFMTDADVQFLFRTQEANYSIDQLIAQESQTMVDSSGVQTTIRNPDPFQIQYEGSPSGMEAGLQHLEGPLGTQDQVKSLRITEALNMPFNMTRAEVLAMSAKLKKAGFYERVGGEPQINGDASDRFFKEAWRLLLSTSIQSNRKVVDVLTEQSTAYEEAIAKSIEVHLSDPSRIRMSADSLGQSMLGRRLKPDEHRKLVASIQGFERTAGRAAFDGEGEQTDVDVDARLADMINNANPAEAGAHDVSETYNMLGEMLRGPGRGVG